MTDTIEGARIVHVDGHEAVEFGIRVDSVHHFCVVSKKDLHGLSAPGQASSDLLKQFGEHRALIYEKAAAAIRGGLKGEPKQLDAKVLSS